MQKDKEVFDLIGKELERQRHGIELIASENFTSLQVMQAMGTVLTNKYAEGYPGRRYYGGCEIVDQVEQLAIDRLKDIFGCAYANVQPHSGAQANASLLLAILQPGDTILGLDLSMGGHLTHGSPVNFSGKLYRPVFYGVGKADGRVDYESMEAVAKKEKPKLIICGASAYSRDWDYKRIRAIADGVGAFVMCDMAHPAGLIAKGLLNSPFEDCHFVTSTTHKTLRGPRGGIILLDKDDPAARPTQGLMRRRRHEMTIFEGGVQQPFRDQPCRMSHIAHDKSADAVGNGPDPLVVPVTAISRSPADDQLWFFFFGDGLHTIIIHPPIRFPDAIEDRTVQLTRKIDRRSVCQVATH